MKPIYVRDVYDRKCRQSMLVYAEEPLEDVLRSFAKEPWLRGIFVMNRAGRLEGVTTRVDLLDWARLRLGTVLRGPSLTRDRILRLAELVRAATARDVIHPGSQKAAVRPNDPVDHALQLMHEIDLIAIPVVDDEGRILGDLTLSHVLRYLLDLEGGV